MCNKNHCTRNIDFLALRLLLAAVPRPLLSAEVLYKTSGLKEESCIIHLCILIEWQNTDKLNRNERSL